MCSAFVRAEHVGDDKLGTPERTPAADDELRVGDRQHPEEEDAALGRGVLREDLPQGEGLGDAESLGGEGADCGCR